MQTNLVLVALSLVRPPIEDLYIIFVTSLAMLYVKIVYSAKVLDTRCIMGYNVELWKVEIALICSLVD